MNKKNAIFITDRDGFIDRIYKQDVVEKMKGFLNVCETTINSRNLEEFKDTLRETQYIFSTWGMVSLTDEQIDDYFPKLEAIFYAAGSVQSFCRPYLRRGVRIFTSWVENDIPVWEMTAAQVLLATKGFWRCTGPYKYSNTLKGPLFRNVQKGNKDITVAVLGLGMVGRGVIKFLRETEIKFTVYDPYVSDELIAEYGATRVTLEEAFKESDVVVNAIANRPMNVGMLNYDLFNSMMDDAIFINPGRGAQVVEADLCRALREKPERFALLDVTDPEPVIPDSEINNMDNIIITPHIAGPSGAEYERLGEVMVEEASRIFKLLPANPDKEVFLHMLDVMA